jgi:predicted protein tyrosine phosphatase
MKNILFICGRNKLRSPTAERIFSGMEGIETASAGTNPDADNPLDREIIEWADVIFVMEKTHRQKLTRKYRTSIARKRVICLDIPDKFTFMAPELVRLLKTKVTPHLK